jgi:putative membrane protein
MSDTSILRDAGFDPRVKSYWTWKPVLAFTLGIVTIPIAILYAVVAGFFIDRYLANLRCTLTERTLDIKKGIWNKTESTIPLDKITDLQLFQGPVMRYFGLHGFKVETAGQSSPTGGALVNIIGIVETKAFRKAVLEQRDRMGGGASTVPDAQAAALGSGDRQTDELLTEIRDSLQRIEQSITSRPDR